jgi:drug/metabolite transporter superfamily protein YnfA
VAGLLEIAGGWLIWQPVRDHRPPWHHWWWCLLGVQPIFHDFSMLPVTRLVLQGSFMAASFADLFHRLVLSMKYSKAASKRAQKLTFLLSDTSLRLKRSAGGAVLVAYGFVPTLQPEFTNFSRTYAVYGGIFILLSYGWGWAVDNITPDIGDWIGTALAVAGVMLAWFWPRQS